jgi:hypothetical protein
MTSDQNKMLNPVTFVSCLQNKNINNLTNNIKYKIFKIIFTFMSLHDIFFKLKTKSTYSQNTLTNLFFFLFTFIIR